MPTNPAEPKRQPQFIVHKGVHYTLHTPFRWIDEAAGVCEGPLYRMEKHDESTLYMPDAYFLFTPSAPLTWMHAITFRSTSGRNP